MKKIISWVVIFASLFLLVSCLTSCNSSKPRDISTVSIDEEGKLVVRFTDGSTSVLGVVVGKDGADGQDGKDGAAGKDGLNGKDGAAGVAGQNGKDGKDGKDGEVGPKGENGTPGKDGKEIASITLNSKNELEITYNDATQTTVSLATLYLFGGTCGEGVQWGLFAGGMLILAGSGTAENYEAGQAPWSFLKACISAVCYESSITLGANTLADFSPEIIHELKVPQTEDVWVDMAVEAPLRSSESLTDDSNIITMLPLGTNLKRLEKGEKVSKVVYQNAEAYIENRFLAEKPGSVVYNETDDTITITGQSGANLRSYPDATQSENIIVNVPKGTVLKRTGVSQNGNWSRVEYQGKVLYCYHTVYETQS